MELQREVKTQKCIGRKSILLDNLREVKKNYKEDIEYLDWPFKKKE